MEALGDGEGKRGGVGSGRVGVEVGRGKKILRETCALLEIIPGHQLWLSQGGDGGW